MEIRKKINTDIVDLEDESNQLDELKISILDKNKNNPQDIKERIDVVDSAITALKSKLLQQRNLLSNYLNFKSRTKWFEYGEKSNKFFLNLAKSKVNQSLITSITCNNKTVTGQEDVKTEIVNFYRTLYETKPRNSTGEDNFYKNCPKLTNDQAATLDNELTLPELLKALNTCKDSSPGPDGIPYIVYKKLWRIAGPIILNSWKFSIANKTLPPSHLESVITLLPKEGKDIRDIKNWRPITLSNCDAKIITKALACKVSKVLDSIIDEAQTAYVPGRSVADNLRTNFFFKTHCKMNNIDAVLISLDAKKAFDSVDHRYIEETLIAYGFGKGFIDIFKLLYKDLTARILVNGFLTEAIKIGRGVKQGDALSCAIFIICIDPLLRNINKSNKIEGIEVRRNGQKITFKGGAYADDVSIICSKKRESIQEVFNEYNRLTERSGLEFNAEKTEILRLNTSEVTEVQFNYNNMQMKVDTIQKIKICGLFFSSDTDEEYDLNVIEKIKKLGYKIKLWTARNLTIEGKILIVKTFGLSQLIYNMQSYEFKDVEITNTERIIFKFIWSTSKNQNGIDRISRAIMKNDYEKGGMKVTDVESLDRSIKLRQYIRAQKSSHIISKIQSLVTEDCGQGINLKQEYYKISSKEVICKSAQETLNKIIDYNRQTYVNLTIEEIESDRHLIDEVSSINLKTFLERKGRVFLICILKPILNEGITTLGELTLAYEHEHNNKVGKAMKVILNSFPSTLRKIAECYCEDINNTRDRLRHVLVSPSRRVPIESITTKELQSILKIAMKKVQNIDFKTRLNFDYDSTNIIRFRMNCKNAKLRNIYFRLIHKDFFTYVRMKKFKMTQTDKCPRCGITESISHLLWECTHANNIWREYNKFLMKTSQQKDCVNDYQSIYSVAKTPATILIKIRVIQELIQMARPTCWNEEKMEAFVKDLISTEKYIANKNYTVDKFFKKWKLML